MKRLMILGAIVMVVITACSSSGSKSSSVTTPPAGATTTSAGVTTTSAGVTTTSAGAASTAAVVVKNIAYNPSTSRVHVGDVVRWEFQDGAVVHNVDGKGSLPDFFSGNPQSSGAYQYTFRTAGTYHYHCDVHPTMTGTVIVS